MSFKKMGIITIAAGILLVGISWLAHTMGMNPADNELGIIPGTFYGSVLAIIGFGIAVCDRRDVDEPVLINTDSRRKR